jgi:hypothetical protein
MLTVYDRAFRISGKTVVFKGKSLVMNWPFIWINAIPIVLTWEELQFPMTILSKDKIPMEGEVQITGEPDTEKLDRFIRSGKWPGIKKELYGIALREVRKICTGVPGEYIMQQKETISGSLEKSLRKVMEERDFGFKLIKAQAVFQLPDDIQSSYREKTARQKEYDADMAAAQSLMNTAKSNDEKLTFKEAFDRSITLRLVRDGRMNRIDLTSSGEHPVGTVLIPNANMTFGDSGGGSGKNKKDKKKGDD